MRVAILFNSPQSLTDSEREKQLAVEGDFMTVEAVEQSLHALGHTTARLPIEDDISGLLGGLKESSPNLVFNLCETFRRENLPQLNIPALLEVVGIPYTGSGPAALGISTDKALTKALLSANGIPVPPFQVFYEGDQQLSAELSFPLIVKPLYEDGSYGIATESVVDSAAKLAERVNYVRDSYHQPAIVEAFVDGREIQAPILGASPPVVLSLSEIEYRQFPASMPRVLTFAAKWIPDTWEYEATVPVCPAALPPQVEEAARDLAVRAHLATGCRDYSRIDMRLGADSRPQVIEVNANPDLTPGHEYTRSLLQSGLAYTDLVACLIEGALRRKLH